MMASDFNMATERTAHLGEGDGFSRDDDDDDDNDYYEDDDGDYDNDDYLLEPEAGLRLFQRIPNEVLEQILSNLQPNEICQAASVCRSVALICSSVCFLFDSSLACLFACSFACSCACSSV